MARYSVRYVSYAKTQLKELKGPLRQAYDSRIKDLQRDPQAVGDYSTSDRMYTAAFSASDGSASGIILYTVSEKIVTVTVIRVNWVKWQ